MLCARLRPALYKEAQGLCTLWSVLEPDTSHMKQGSSRVPDTTCPFPVFLHALLVAGVGQNTQDPGSVHILVSTSMKPRVTACSKRYSYIPRIDACSVLDGGQTLHTGNQSAASGWCWSQTEHGTPGLPLILVIARSGHCTYEARVFAYSCSCWSHIVDGKSPRSLQAPLSPAVGQHM